MGVEFISWIEVETSGKSGGKKEVLFLTDADVFSEYGREVLKGTSDNDVLGHWAIVAFFRLSPTDGRRLKARCFWETAGLPRVIAQKINNFDEHFGRMFREHFLNSDLTWMVGVAPQQWKTKAWKELLRRQVPDSEICGLLYHNSPGTVPLAWMKKVLKELVRRNAPNSTFKTITWNSCPEWVKEEARSVLHKRGVSGY